MIFILSSLSGLGVKGETMHDVYSFVTGPLAWLAFLLFIGGSLFQLGRMLYLVAKKERFIFSYMSWKYSLRSILHWITPFATVNWKCHPILTIVTFAFHICLLATPLFLLSHIILWDEAWNISWWAFPDALADVMTVVVILSCLFFLVRRLRQPRGTGLLEVGAQAPGFELGDHLGQRHRLSDYRGRKLVLWFYPKAATPG
jgi:hypothetical protein